MSEENKDSLTLGTIQNVLQIIDVCSKRGAFRAEELEEVGKTFNQLKGFVEYVTKQQQQNKEVSAQAANEPVKELVEKTI
tara:strand:- start:618 stop:857 length:240 start_codon:yes stop_codon:yes gene_type:complete